MNLTIPNLTAEQITSIQEQVGGVTPAPPAEDWGTILEYDGAFSGHWTPPASKFNVVGISQGTNTYPVPRPPWGSRPTYVSAIGYHSSFVKEGDTYGSADWGTSREFHRLTPFRGQSWLVIDGYGPTDGSAFYVNTCERCDWVNLDSGAVTDLTYAPAELQGQVYMPTKVYSSGHYRLRFWGTVGGGPFYWEGDFTYGKRWSNVAWQQGQPAIMRQSIEIREGWWSGDHTGAWIDRSTGTPPYDADGKPIVPQNTYLGFNALGRLAGSLWRFDYPPNVAGLESIE